MGGKCFKQSPLSHETSFSDLDGSFVSLHTTPIVESSPSPSEKPAPPTTREVTQYGFSSIAVAPAKRQARRKRKAKVEPTPVQEDKPPKSYVVECKVLINACDATHEYRQLQQKALKLFANATTTAPKPAKRKVKKQKGKAPEKVIGRMTQEQLKNFEETKPMAKKNNKRIGERESFCSRITEDGGEDLPELYEPCCFKAYQGSNKRTTKQQNIHYVKKTAPATFIEKLNKEIAGELTKCTKFYRAVFPFCLKIQQHIQYLVRHTFSDHGICATMYGSMATGLAYESSDLDLAICGLPLGTREELNASINKLSERLKLDPWVISCQAITTARVPIIKLSIDLGKINKKPTYPTLKVDITFDAHIGSDVFYGIQCTDLVCQLCEERTYLKPTVVLLKKLLKAHGLNVSYFGGLSSFTLTLIISALLAMSQSMPSPGHCFLGVLEYFGKIFDPAKMAIMGDCIVPMGVGALFVADPFRPEINAAGNVTKFTEIQDCFARCYEGLLEAYQRWEACGYTAETKRSMKILNELVYSNNNKINDDKV